MWFAATEAATAAAYNIHNAAYYLFIYKYISYLTSRQTDDDCQGIIIIVTRLTTRMCVRGVCLFTVFIIIIIIFYFTSSLYYLRGKPSTLSYGARAVENYRLLARLGVLSLSPLLCRPSRKIVFPKAHVRGFSDRASGQTGHVIMHLWRCVFDK